MSAPTCSFCGKREDEVRALVPGPPPASICDVCVSLCEDIVGKESGGPQEPTDAQETEAESEERARLRAAVAEYLKRHPRPDLVLACSFCGKAKDDVHKLVAGPRVFICDECVRRCSDVLAEQGK